MLPHDASPTLRDTGEPLVGREAELRRLEGYLAGVIAGDGCVVFLTGEPGIGKTTLAGEFLRRVRQSPDITLCRGRCVDQYGAGEAYLPFLDALGALISGPERDSTLALMKTYAPTWCLQVPAAAPTPEERADLERRTVGATKERMLREVVDGLSAAAARFPVVVLLEDLQWADPSTIDAVRFLGKRLVRQRIMVLGTFRLAEIEVANHPLKACRLDLLTESHSHEIALGPLGPAQVGEYLDARFPGHRFPPELAAFVHHRTEGQPLFIVNIVDLLAARGDIVRVEEAFTLARPISESDHDVPESLREMIRRKVDSLPEAERTALQAASVIGRDFLSTVLASVLDADELALEERLLRLDRIHRVVEARGEEELPDGSLAARYRFVHGLYQDVLYEDLASKRRTTLHQRVGQMILRHYRGDAPPTAALALHFERGRDFPGAINALVQAGERATGMWAYGEALEHFGHALRLLERPDEPPGRRLLVHQRRGHVLHALARFDEAAADFRRMREQALRSGDATLEFAALSGLCDALFFSGQLEEMAVRAHEALGVAGRLDSSALQAEALVSVAQLVEAEGRLREAIPVFDEVVAESRRLGHEGSLLSALAFRGYAQYWQSDYGLAEAAFAEAVVLAERQRDGFLALPCRMLLGLSRGNQGRLSAARLVFEEAIELARRNGDRVWLPQLVSQLGWIHRELQDFDGACARDEEGLRIAREGDVVMAPGTEGLLSLSTDYARAGRVDEAWRVIEELTRIRERRRRVLFGWLDELRWEVVVAELWLLRGDLAQAREHARRLTEVATSVGTRSYVAAAHRLLSRAALQEGNVETARKEAEAALRSLGEVEPILEAWTVYATVGRVRLRAGERERARAAFREAEARVRTIAAGVTDAALRETFLASPAVREVQDGARAPDNPPA